jgi:hypothetical protein
MGNGVGSASVDLDGEGLRGLLEVRMSERECSRFVYSDSSGMTFVPFPAFCAEVPSSSFLP